MQDARYKACQRCCTTFERRRRDSKSQWAARLYCSRACGYAAKREMAQPSKPCPHCGEPFFKPGKISHAQWQARHFCSYACATASSRQARPLCACGCGEEVNKPHHTWVRGHDSPPLWRVRTNPNAPDRPRCYVPCRGGQEAAWARVVMQNVVGRSLRSDEHVHHINGDTLDDRPENLELLTAVEHARLHMQNGDYHQLSAEERRRNGFGDSVAVEA